MKNISLVLSLSAVVASGCSVTGATFGAGGKCVTNSDCTTPLQCVANVCIDTAAASASGGSDGGAGGSAGGSANGGSSSSAGGGAASSSLRFVNAAPKTSVARTPAASPLDVCVKLHSDASFGTTGLIGTAAGQAYGTGSDLLAAPAGSLDLRVIAAGHDCSVGSRLFDLALPVDTSDAGTFTVVAYGDTTTTVNGVTVIETVAPTLATNAHISLVHALADETNVAITVPATSLATSLANGGSLKADIAPLSNQTVTVAQTDSAIGHTFLFAGISLPAASQTTIIVLGDANATLGRAPQLLVCNDTKATAGCTSVTSELRAYLRFADLNGDPLSGNPVGLTLCARDHGTNDYAAVGTATYGGAFSSFTGFTARTIIAAGVDFAVVPATGTQVALIPSTCDAAAVATAFVTSTEVLTGGSYNTLAFTKTTAQHLVNVVTQPSATVPNSVNVTVFNGLSDHGVDFGPVNVTLPELFGKTLAVSLASSAAASLTLPSAYLPQLASREIRFQLAGSNARVQSTIDVPATATALSIWLGGDDNSGDQVFVCADDGSVDANGNSVCTAFAVGAKSTSLPNGRLRVANLSAVPGAAIDVCKDTGAGTTPLFSNVAVDTLSAFTGATAVSTFMDFYVVPHASVTPCSQSNPVHVSLNSPLSDPNYYTLFVVGDVTPTIQVKQQVPPVTVAGNFSVNLTNDWTGSGIDTFLVDGSAAGSLAVLASQNYQAFATSSAQLALQSDTLSPTTDFTFDFANTGNVPLLDGGVYEAISLSASASEPEILWCNDEWIVGATTACIGIAHD